MSGLRIVAPFFPLPAENDHHLALTDFDWIGAIRMLFDSVRRACGDCPVHVITDVSADLPLPTVRYVTHHRRLMLWYLEAAACYLESDDFDRDTVMLDSDQLVYGDLSRWFVQGMDLGILARDLPPKDPNGYRILNGVQWWSHRAKGQLGAFYRKALALAQTFPEETIAWGADTRALEHLLDPLDVGCWVRREGLSVGLFNATEVLERLSGRQIRQLRARQPLTITRSVLDFRNMRKVYMRPVFEATLGRELAGASR